MSFVDISKSDLNPEADEFIMPTRHPMVKLFTNRNAEEVLEKSIAEAGKAHFYRVDRNSNWIADTIHHQRLVKYTIDPKDLMQKFGYPYIEDGNAVAFWNMNYYFWNQYFKPSSQIRNTERRMRKTNTIYPGDKILNYVSPRFSRKHADATSLEEKVFSYDGYRGRPPKVMSIILKGDFEEIIKNAPLLELWQEKTKIVRLTTYNFSIAENRAWIETKDYRITYKREPQADGSSPVWAVHLGSL